MSKPMIRIHDTQTNEIIDREMTNAEFAQYKLANEKAIAYSNELEAKAAAKAAAQLKLAALGLTVEDLQALGL
jgi:hypothetical protein